MRLLAAVLLLLGLIRHQMWELLPDQIQALAWNAAGALTHVALLLLLFLFAAVRLRPSKKSKALYLVLGWWLYEEFAVITCSAVRMVWTLEVRPGQAQCDALTSLPVSSLSVAIVAVLAIKIHRETGNHDKS